jgi:hypothetical protein
MNAADVDQARALLDAEPDVLAKLWQQVDALWRHRAIDPELRVAILRVAQHVDPALVSQIERELDEATPAAVLEAHQDELIEDRSTLGAFPRRDAIEVPTVSEWIAEDPRRLRGVVFEACRFTSDDRRVAEGVLSLAGTLGIDLHLAADIVGYALRDARHPEAVAK